jgi:hypothetical protein
MFCLLPPIRQQLDPGTSLDQGVNFNTVRIRPSPPSLPTPGWLTYQLTAFVGENINRGRKKEKLLKDE